MSGHTPGPWTFTERDAHGGYVIQFGPDGAQTPEEVEANARLITAAPELLAALKAITSRHEGYQAGMGPCVCEGHVAARAAIAKAERGPIFDELEIIKAAGGVEAHRVADDINARLDPAYMSAATEAAYREMPVFSLKCLLHAFSGDRDQTGTSEYTRRFCQSRVDLITRILAEARR